MTISWTPTKQQPRPPHNPYKDQANQSAYLKMVPKEKPPAVPCPIEVKAEFERLLDKFRIDKETRDERYATHQKKRNGQKLSHLDQVSITDAADEQWFGRNQARVMQLVRSPR